jgi:hypothetical protein
MADDNRFLFLDFETYYDTEYSLKKMPTPNYIIGPKYETIMVAAKELGQPGKIIDGPDFPNFLATYDPAKTTTVTYNALFDNSILAWRYGFVPHTMIDAMGMARALLGHKLNSFSLNNIARHLGLGEKTGALIKVQGLRRADIMAAGLWQEFCAYAMQDNELAEGIFLKLYPEFPRSERRLMDMVLRCCIEPRFQCDAKLLEDHLVDVRAEKELLIASCGADKSILMSNPKFRIALEELGVEIEMKISPTTGKEAPAFARTDQFMEDLKEHFDPRVQALAAARLGLKSTLEETRSETLLSIASLPWATYEDGSPRLYSGGNMPIPLRYGGAHTHRLSGDWKMNMQNMPTARGSKGKSKLRHSLKVPPDHKVIVADLGQIEARLVAWICKCLSLLDQFANKKDPYNILASAIFGRPVNRKLVGTLDEIMGFIGKTGILGLGYGAGKDKFDTMVVQSARKMEIDISAIYNRVIGDKAVDAYRSMYPEIPRGWETLDRVVRGVWLKGGAPVHFGPCTISYGAVELPNGMFLRYEEPFTRGGQRKGNDGQMFDVIDCVYRYGKFTHKLYGAKFLENIVQALARIVVMNAALRIRDRGFGTPNPADYRFALQAHDELVFIIHKDEVDRAKQVIHTEMTRRPSWAPDLPLTADVGVGDSYGEAK